MMCRLVVFLAGLLTFVSGHSPPDADTGCDVVVHRLEKMLVDLTKRVEDLEVQRQSDILEMSILQHNIENLKYGNRRRVTELNRVTSNQGIQREGNTHKGLQQLNPDGPPEVPDLNRKNHSSGFHPDNQQRSDSTFNNGTKYVGDASEVQQTLIRRKSYPGVTPHLTNRVASTGYVAFFSSLKHLLTDVANEQAIHFENVVTNNGGHYSQNTGVFTCPIEGTYVFSWTIYASGAQYIDTELVKNSVAVAYSRAGDSAYHEASSTSAIVNLNPGDEVWIRVKERSPGADIKPMVSMFCGFEI
ncbi:complement C1q tumor necrosis factor-related protein 3-like [Argopecten irradians]|uniref:complement C1q tumor necrosis factor-related protein 3-like n=1 Tax=Argopecten irradians TaxID=31199 RepID=UPI00371CFC0E